MSKKYLVLKGHCGLGDRLHALLSAIEYAQKTNRVLYIDWTDSLYDQSKRNIFNDYFYLKNIPHTTDPQEIISSAKSFYPKLWQNVSFHTALNEMYVYATPVNITKIRGIYWLERKFGGRLGRLLRYWKYIGSNNKEFKKTDRSAIKSVFSSKDMSMGCYLGESHKEDVVIFADSVPPIKVKSIHDYLSLDPSIEDTINSFACLHNISDKTIGVHIRNTDLTPNKDINLFVERLKQFMSDNRYENVFLATDSIEVELLFEKEISNIIRYPKELIQNNTQGLHNLKSNRIENNKLTTLLAESIIDLWLLSKCNFLFYQGNSSFSIFAQKLKEDESHSIDWLKW